jgi:molybdopterin-containing oxidoreductase family membrane subunit
VERFLLLDGGVYTELFWIVQIGLGSVLPLILLYGPAGKSRLWIGISCLLVIIGGLAQMYVIIIGGQAYPMEMFPGKEVIESSFYDGMVGYYSPSLPEFVLGIGGVALALAATVVGTRVLRFLPVSLADDMIEPYQSGADA